MNANYKILFSQPSEGNRVFDGNATDNGFSGLDGDLIGTFRDADGSVYSANAQIVKDLPFHMTPNCSQRSNWKMMPCVDTFGQVNIVVYEIFLLKCIIYTGTSRVSSIS